VARLDLPEILSHSFHLERTIRLKTAQLARLSAMRARAAKTVASKKLPGLLAQIARHEEEVAGALGQQLSLAWEIQAAIEAMAPGREKECLLLRYVMLKTWEEVAEAMHYDPRSVYRVHRKGLQALERQGGE